MKLEHKFVVPAPVEETWAAFNDLERVVPCFPGATLASYEGDDFTGACKVKLGPVSLQYTGTGTFVERDGATHRAVIEAKGKDRRGNGTAAARVTANLTATSDTTTEVTVDTDLTITGRPAQFGRGLILDVSNKLLDQFTTCLTTKLNTTPEPGLDPPDSAPPGSLGGSAAAGSLSESSAGSADSGSSSESSVGSSGGSSVGSDGSAASEEEAAVLDLGSALLPMLARRAAPYLIGAVLALIVRRLFRR
ncbi:carbon monoxide dehydrogenase subunit G [Kribbella aluminosa]|uniref:Carbon monoxide dehydrogenase subunit G n=1 Tax=Kribbella aluminosa TaxID=416017 RepID=A0ABS4UZ54_9ACTN|nr:SRPBCC family protein [Kribbella aluminosa]MBP2356939.1 carbon monoxide dehydrogenase subunit G [Kribbella aluminosa]